MGNQAHGQNKAGIFVLMPAGRHYGRETSHFLLIFPTFAAQSLRNMPSSGQYSTVEAKQ
jgi:hypothetical protein